MLKKIISFFALFAAIRIGLSIEFKSDNKKPKNLLSYLAGSGIGFLSSILGIGGGMFSVPYFKGYGLSMKMSVGTAAACGIPIALFASFGYFFMGLNNTSLPNLSLGYIYIPNAYSSAAVFTKNNYVASSVEYTRKCQQKNTLKALIVNSGNANACTGKEGISNAKNVLSLFVRSLALIRNTHNGYMTTPANTGCLYPPLFFHMVVANVAYRFHAF